MDDSGRGRAFSGRSLALAIFLVVGRVQADEPAAITIRLLKPGDQIRRVIDLFEGSRARDPAAALAAWKHARPVEPALTKRGEALIALFNPGMATELKTLDDAVLKIVDFDLETGRGRWHVVAPADDGTFAALITSVALETGAVDQPINKLPVFRLGVPGTPFAASAPDRLALGSTRAELRAALHEPIGRPFSRANAESGAAFQLTPALLKPSSSLALRRIGAALGAVGGRETLGHIGVEHDALACRINSRLDPPRKSRPGVDPAWLEAIPAARTVIAFAIAIETTPHAIDEAFATADAIEKADPARARVAPLRSRLNLLAAVARVRPEEFWPRLRGVSGFLLASNDKRAAGGAFVIHMADALSAKKLVDDVFPKLLKHYRWGESQKSIPGTPKPLDLRIDGEAVTLEAHGSAVWFFWGPDARFDARRAATNPTLSAGPALRAGWGKAIPHRAGAFWPGRSRTFDDPASPLALALIDAPPAVWRGYDDGPWFHDELLWPGLKPLVARVLETLPLDPPPDP